jgi:ATP-dependent Lhr-like helicase
MTSGAFNPIVQAWFEQAFASATRAQILSWPPILRGESTLLCAPTGSGKTLAAFLACIDRLMFSPPPPKDRRCRVLYVSPLKALAVDVERNLRAPLLGIARLAEQRGAAFTMPEILVRTGDTPSKERARFLRQPADIVISTPESFYLMLTSNASELLRSVETIIVDEIHALVPSKRGTHLALSLERLQSLTAKPLQRIGLSATQRPLEEVAQFLGGVVNEQQDRPVTIIDASEPKKLALTIEVPLEDMTKIVELPAGPAAVQPAPTSIWSAIHPRLVELVKQHNSTLIFCNSRRLSERLAGAMNELAGETLVYAHHGSIARPQRVEIEDRLKSGGIRALVCTSSLELGIDMGAVDLVVQIEAPPSVASGLQRIGRASHQVGAVSKGIIFPKYRADLLACAALSRAMHEGRVEVTRYPRKPLDILAQQLVAMVAMCEWEVDALFALVRQAAPYATLTRRMFDNVLDMLSGRYASDDLADLKPRLTWDRIANKVKARETAKRVAISNGGTIPDRGLFGVFLAGAKTTTSGRIGELDEEMVFESRVGETFVLGASTWRIEEITHDRVLVSPAPGEPGKMPFWRGDQPSRPFEVGAIIGQFSRELLALPAPAAVDRLHKEHDLDRRAAANLLAYLREQQTRAGAVPDDQTILVERCKDELGDYRVCVLTPFGTQLHAPWAMAASALIKQRTGLDVETMWTNDGFVIRFPGSDVSPDASLMLPTAAEVEALLTAQLGSTSMFAARFRENAARSLLLTRRRPGQRTPLWMQRKKAYDLLAAVSQHDSFPILLETYRECLQDVFDLPALFSFLTRVQRREVKVVTLDSQKPSPFASALLFGFVANYLYDGDSPLAERRAQALSIDQAQLRELLGDAELRELLDAEAIADVHQQLQQRSIKSADALHDALLRLGDLTRQEIVDRADGDAGTWIGLLEKARRIVPLRVAETLRYVAVEDAARYRDALGIVLPSGLPASLLGPVPDALGSLVLRYARTHVPFTLQALSGRFGLQEKEIEPAVKRLVVLAKLMEGAFLPGGTQREFVEPEVLAQIRRRSLAKLRREIEPVAPAVLGRALLSWQGVATAEREQKHYRRKGLDALLDTVEQLQGAPLIASALDREILPARIEGYMASDLDALIAAGEVLFVGVESLGDHDGRIALYLTDHFAKLWRRPPLLELNEAERAIVDYLKRNGASFFASLHSGVGGGFAPDLLETLWSLFFRGVITNDTLRPLRAYVRGEPSKSKRERSGRDVPSFRSRRAVVPAAEGRWSLLESRAETSASDTVRAAALAEQLIARYGVVTREVAQVENIGGGFTLVYDVLKTLEEQGRVRRGYFVSGVGAMQFAAPGAVERLRSLRDLNDAFEVAVLAATDPANPYGALLKWPAPGLSRSAGAQVVLVGGALGAYLPRSGRSLHVFLPELEPDRSQVGRALAGSLPRRRDGIDTINGTPAVDHPFAAYLIDAGYVSSSAGFFFRGPGRLTL